MKRSIKTKGVCAPQIDFEIDDEKKVRGVKFHGGCAGNTLGLANLIEGMPVQDAIAKMRGIICRNGTSCPDQLARGLESALQESVNSEN